MGQDDSYLSKPLEWILDVDVNEVKAFVENLEQQRLDLKQRDLAERIFSKAIWKATGTGVITGLPSTPWTAVPSAAMDITAVLKTEYTAAARVAVIYDECFFDDDDNKWLLFITILGLNTSSQFLRDLGIRGGMGVTRAAIKKYLSKGTLKAFKRIMVKYFGLKVTQKGLITKTLPIVGGLIGGTWNWFEVRKVRDRIILYFEEEHLQS